MDQQQPESQGKFSLDCSQFWGRKRSICDGTSGLSEEKRQAYLRLWAGQSGPGDWLAKLIHKVTGKRPCRKCRQRKAALNRIWASMLEFFKID